MFLGLFHLKHCIRHKFCFHYNGCVPSLRFLTFQSVFAFVQLDFYMLINTSLKSVVGFKVYDFV